ncbi:MAG TPA: hypothetical protein VD965_13495 [Burkholderiales bacterium]|nr:hypothetical protein [Burkholderiales bacterium]
MRIWPALLVVPLLALTSIALGYALITPACSHGEEWLLHAATLLFFLMSLAATLLAWREKIASTRDPFLPLVATWTGAFFSLVIAAQWLTQLVLPPCTHLP